MIRQKDRLDDETQVAMGEKSPLKYDPPENRRSAGDKGKFVSLWRFLGYFLKLGAIGFGGPIALDGFMNRDLVEKQGWVSEDEYKLGLTLAQVMPGPMAAQLGIALGYFQYGILGATLVALAFGSPASPGFVLDTRDRTPYTPCPSRRRTPRPGYITLP